MTIKTRLAALERRLPGDGGCTCGAPATVNISVGDVEYKRPARSEHIETCGKCGGLVKVIDLWPRA